MESRRYYFISDEEYERAALNGIPKRVLDQRIRRYMWDKERAITEKLRRKLFTKEQIAIAKENGIHYQTLVTRIEKCKNWSIEEAITTPPLNYEQRKARQKMKATT